METQPSPANAPNPEPAAKVDKQPESWWGTLRFFAILFLVTVMVRSFVFAPFMIPSGSMLPNLMIGDYLFVTKWPYGWSRYSMPFGLGGFSGRVWGALPDRGDIVVFRYPGQENEDFVKRVIGLPGDRISVRDGAIILNGRPVERQRIADYAMPVSPNSPCRIVADDPANGERQGPNGRECRYPRYQETLPGGRSYQILDQGRTMPDDFAEIIVPQGHLFVMGDNRDDSADSRVAQQAGGVGLLPVDNVLGEVLVAFWSTDGSVEWLKPWTWFSAARWSRIGTLY
ncbi:MAG: signal peptidase I [Sphingomonas sp.]